MNFGFKALLKELLQMGLKSWKYIEVNVSNIQQSPPDQKPPPTEEFSLRLNSTIALNFQELEP